MIYPSAFEIYLGVYFFGYITCKEKSVVSVPREGGGEGTPYNGLYGEDSPEGVPFSGFMRYVKG